MAQAIALALVAGSSIGQANAQKAFSGAWFAAKGAVQSTAAQTGMLPNGMPAMSANNPDAQRQKADEQLVRSINNLGMAARGIAAQQSAQAAARAAALAAEGGVPDGLTEGGLKIDSNSLTAGWINANAPKQSTAGGKTQVAIEQTADKAILNWETFNVGKNTTVEFQQQKNWSLLNRVNDPQARPSQIQGHIKGDGTVMVVNRNGIVFSGSSQIDTRNLVAAAVGMSDSQFGKGLYSSAQGNAHIPSFANDLNATASSFTHGGATGDVIVEQGAQITTRKPASVTEGGGYVLLLGREAHNRGAIETPSGQAVLAGGDAFVIKKGMGTDANQGSTTRGNVVTPLLSQGSAAGVASNSGLMLAPTGDITLIGRDVRQQGVAVATTSVHTRGTVHLSNAVSGTNGSVLLDKGSVTAIVLDETVATALDTQRDALIKESDKVGDGVAHRRDQSLILIDSATGAVNFASDSLTLATGGQVLVNASRAQVAERALIDVSGAVGVRVAMESNNVLVNVQGNEQRDAPVNRDEGALRNNNIWVDRRYLVKVPAGTNGYTTDRWYTAGGLLEVGGYLGTTGHSIGEWAAQGGTVQFSGGALETHAGSWINLAGGTLDVQTGYVYQTFLKGSDGRFYAASSAPGDLLYTGLYKGYETYNARWGDAAKQTFYNPLIAPARRLENGYTVGRDAGRLIVATQSAVLEGNLDTGTYQGLQQTRGRDVGLDGYDQAQTAVAQRGQLVVGSWTPVYDAATASLRFSPGAIAKEVLIGQGAQTEGGAVDGRIVLDARWLNDQKLGVLGVYAQGGLTVDDAVTVAPGGSIALHATQVNVNADLTARGGRIMLGNMVERMTNPSAGWVHTTLTATPPETYTEQTTISEGVTLDARGLWVNLRQDDGDASVLPFVNGGRIEVRSTGDVHIRPGSLLDVSSGAALLVDGRERGGKGGGITLIADGMPGTEGRTPGRLVLEGELRGHGVGGGGTLHLQTGQAVVIGGQVAGSNGQLVAGQSSLSDLVLGEAFTVAEGAVLPMDYLFVRSLALPGEALGGAPLVDLNNTSSYITLASDWLAPVPSSGYYQLWMSSGSLAMYNFSQPTLVRAGTVIRRIENPQNFPTNYVVPADAFPNGINISPTTVQMKAGTVAPSDVTFAAGTVLKAGTTLPQTVAVSPLLHLDNTYFSQGFGQYEVVGAGGMTVAEGAQLHVRMPVLRLDRSVAQTLPSGADPSDALALWEPALFTENPQAGELTQRSGASLSLIAGHPAGERMPALTVGRGALVEVDPGQAISLAANGQITVDGTLRAAGGHIDIQGLGYGAAGVSAKGHDRSVWLGEHAVLDVAGKAYTAFDALGRRYGVVQSGGRIQIGDRYDADASSSPGLDSFIVVRPGARLDASGAAALLDLPQQSSSMVAGDGGLIYLSSFNGLYLDGDLRATAGGAGAAGGTLALTLATPNYATAAGPDARVLVHRELALVNQQRPEALAADLQPGQADPGLAYGHARLGVDRVKAGGFDNLSLQVNGVLTLEPGLDLQLGQSLRLTAGSLSLPALAGDGARVKLAAPYVRLAGDTTGQLDHHVMPRPNTSATQGLTGLPVAGAGSTLLVESSLLDLIENVGFGTYGYVRREVGEALVTRPGFDLVELRSQGDMRLLPSGRGELFTTSLTTAGDLVLAASQLYPGTGAKAVVTAGRAGQTDQWGVFQAGYDASRSLRIEHSGGPETGLPYSVFGSLQLLAANIEQGGVVRAPLGTLTIGLGNTAGLPVSSVNLLPGSITSVSAHGIVMPYGGTVDNLTYNYNGLDVPYFGLGAGLGSASLTATAIDVQAGAVLDLRGGGELKGAALLSGRGGSTDARLHPLVQTSSNGFVLPSLSTNPVYAIVPGVQVGAAPVGAEHGAGDPAIGRQITIGSGVPGLPAGTYTLLPSTYALMPGAFRVELNGLVTHQSAFGSTTSMRNGSYSTAARLGVAHTDIVDAQTTPAVLTPADTLRRYAQYNESSYAQFGLDWATRDNVPRPQLERDARVLSLTPGKQLQVAPGAVQFAAAKGGRGGTVSLNGPDIEIRASGTAPTAGYEGLSVEAGLLNDIGASVIAIGGLPQSTFSAQSGYGSTANAWQVGLGRAWEASHSIVLRNGAMLSAPQVMLMTGRTEGGITLEQGASISTLGRGAAAWSADDGYVLSPGAMGLLALSNGRMDALAPTASSDGRDGAGHIHIGVCSTGQACTAESRLYAEGSITVATDKSFQLADSVRYGARDLVLAVGAINVGTQAELANASGAGVLPAGLTLGQQVLDRLLRGDTSAGAPALENLVLTARDSVNFFGDVTLSTLDPVSGKSSLERLVLGAPALYGHGQAGEVASIETDTLVWNGARTPAGTVIAGGAGTGSGSLVVDARQIEFGYGPRSQADTVNSQDRLVLGFGSVYLNASARITANHKGSLAVYQQQGVWNDATKSFDRSGGNLHLLTPLLTGHAGSVNSLTAGGSIVAMAPSGSVSPLHDNATLAGALGATLSLQAGQQLTLDTAVLLPSGKLTLAAQGDVRLQDGAQLDLAGRKINFYDASQYSWGGEVTLQSQGGSVVQQAGSHIDLAAVNNRAGRLTAIAQQGSVDLSGAVDGRSSGYADAGGTWVPFAAATVDVRGLQIADFAGLNARLTEGGVFGGRSFQLGQGDLVIGDELKAREINVSVDRGSLTVNGRIDASGEQAGSIRLAANGGLTLSGNAVLDARASVLRRDSYGQVIEAPNRATIELDSGDGRLVLAAGAAMHLDVAGAGANYGTVALNAPRLGGATGNDVDIDAAGAVRITGARSIAVNAFQRYDNAPVGTEITADGRSYQYIDQAWLDQRHGESATFIRNAHANAALMNGKLAGLRAYSDQFRLRPGVEVVTGGDLHVDGDIDLSGHRYASVNPNTPLTGVYGSGEAGALVLRAGGNLEIFGSISDGFDGSRLTATSDDNGWVLPAGRMPFGGDLVIPHAGLATLDVGTVFKTGRILNYDLPVAGLNLPAGTVLPVAMPLGQSMTLPAGTALAAAVRDANGQVLHAAGTVLSEPLTLGAGQRLDAGFRLPAATLLGATAWPAGVALPLDLTLSQPLTLAKGAIVPSETDVVLPGGATMVDLRPKGADGNQGRTWALAPMLAAGSQSSDLRLVAGSDLGAADARLTQVGSTATLKLADTHFGLGAKRSTLYAIAADASADLIDMLGAYGIVLQAGDLLTPDIVQSLLDSGVIWDGVTNLNDYGYGTVLTAVSTTITLEPARQQLFSVVRTGTGDLDLVSAGDIDMRTPFGVYTAGTASAGVAAGYNQARARNADGTVLQPEGSPFESLVDGSSTSLYAAWYPEHGGNVLLRAGGDLKGDLIGNNGGLNDYGYTFANTRQQLASTAVGNWLWRQGTGSVEAGADAVPTAWWINFGTYVAMGGSGQRDPYDSWLFGNDATLTGFTGVGTLGGGNLRVEAMGDAGMIDVRGSTSRHTPRSQGVHLVVGSTGRVAPDGTLVQTGGGDLDLRLGGTLNPNAAVRDNEHDLNSTFTNLRGALRIDAGAVGGVQLRYGTLDQMDTRTGDPYAAGKAFASGGPILVLGDSTVRIDTRGDLVLGGAADPGRTLQLESGAFSYQGAQHAGNGWSWFSMWTPATAIDLLSAGGQLTPTTAWAGGGGSEDVRWNASGRNESGNNDGYFYPSILRAAAANGSLYYGVGTTGLTNSFSPSNPLRVGYGVTLAPSPTDAQFVNVTGKGELQLLASDSIYASGFAINTSTANPAALPSVFRPGFIGQVAATGGGQYGFDPLYAYNVAPETVELNSWIAREGGRINVAPLFTFGSPATSGYATVGQEPSRYYAVDGDIVGLRAGSEVLLGYPAGAAGVRYEASTPVAIRAGRDITDSGTQLGRKDTVTGRLTSTADTRGNLIAHAFADDVSVVQAGRDIRYSSFYVTGPGLLDISAGRNIYLADKGEFKSLGQIVGVVPGDRASGASIAVAAGMGAGAQWDAFAARYLDPARLANPDMPFADQPGTALYDYSGALTLGQWLAREFGYNAAKDGAPEAYMAAQQAALDLAHQQALASGGGAANRALAREYKVESRLHLVNWLSERFGTEGGNRSGLVFDAAAMDARAFFAQLPPEQRSAYLRNVYYAEIKAGGREYNEVDGKRYGSYLRSREAIATLLPTQDANGQALSYQGDLTMFSSALYYNADYVNNTTGQARPKPGTNYITKAEWTALGSPGYNVSFYDVLDAGIHTNFGGDISIMTPGGRTLVGVDGGFNPGPGSGVMTQGEGDIHIYALDDILMGQSRIFTTFGGNILAWSAQGDINAGRGAKTTVVSTPQQRVYDPVGNVSLSPSTPSTGAGIATLNPIPEVPPGDIDLIAPLGTIDAGEAGIRVSGNVNLAALQVVNAENIQVQGKAVGIPMVAAANVGAMTNASAAASQATVAAQEVLQRERAAARQAMPSVFTVRVVGFGNAPLQGRDKLSQAPATPSRPMAPGYDAQSVLQFVAVGKDADPQQLARLSAEQRRQLQQ